MKDGDDEILTLRIGGKYDPHAEFRYNRHTRLHRALIEYCNKKVFFLSQFRFNTILYYNTSIIVRCRALILARRGSGMIVRW